MKIIAIGEIHYTDKDGKQKIAKPGETLDRPTAEANLLTSGALPAARRLTDAEIELDKLRADAIRKAAEAVAADDDDDDDDDSVTDTGTEKVEAAKTATKTPAKTATKTPAKSGAKADAEGY